MTFRELLSSFCVNDDLSNESVYKVLIKMIKEKRITPVIGAGLSAWAGYPFWHRLLIKKATGTPVMENVMHFLDQGDCESATSVIENFYKKRNFLFALKREYAPEKLCEENRPAYQKLLPMLFDGPIATTNFDLSLDRLIGNPPVFTPSNLIQSEELSYKLRTNQRLLLKMNGSIDDAEHIILSKESYNEYYGSDPYAPDISLPWVHALTTFFHEVSPLFLGCSIGTDRLFSVLSTCGGNPGFALLELPRETENSSNPYSPYLFSGNNFTPALEARLNQMEKTGLQVIWYPHGHHEAVQVLIEQLADEVAITANTSKSASEISVCRGFTSVADKSLIANNASNQETSTSDKIRFNEEQQSHRGYIENLPVLDAFSHQLSWQGLFDAGYIPQRFFMRKSGKAISSVELLCQKYYNKNIIITAPAGYGKTTALLMVYLNVTRTTSQKYLYISASAFISDFDELDEYESSIRNSLEMGKSLSGVILLDGLEEAFGKNYTAATELIKTITKTNAVWVACRRDFYDTIRPHLEGRFSDVAELREWDNNDFQQFLDYYSNNDVYKHATKQIKSLLRKSVLATTTIPKCPLYAFMLLFIASDSPENSILRDEYDLLQTFISLWVNREIKIQKSTNTIDFYFSQFQQIAVDLYINGRVLLKKYPALSLEDGITRGLLRVQKGSNSEQIIRGFYHREFLVFFVVTGMLHAALNSTREIVYWYSQTFYDDVTNLYNLALSHLDSATLSKMYQGFYRVYKESYERSHDISIVFSAFIPDVKPLHFIKLRDEILYFVFNLPGIETDDFMNYADEHCRNTNDHMLMLGLAYGMAGKRQHPLTLSFAKRLENGNPEAAVNRGWAVCFFGDVEGDGYTYQDTQNNPWDNVRAVKLKRLKRTDEKAYRYRLLDIPLLYCFYESRGFRDCVSYAEYKTIDNCDVSFLGYTDEEREFVSEKKKQLAQQYRKCLLAHAVNYNFPLSYPATILCATGGKQMIEINEELADKLLKQEKMREEVSNNMRDFWKSNGEAILAKYANKLNAPYGNALSTDILNEKLNHCKALLLTANPVEGAIITRCLLETSGLEKLDRITTDKITYQFATIRNTQVVHIWPQGTSSFTVHGSFKALRSAFMRFAPKCVFSLGVAFGGDTTKQSLGDVLVSERLVFYDSFNKITDGNLTLSADEAPLVGEDILAGCQFLRFDDPPENSNLDNIKWHLGAMLSGGTVLSDPFEKARLFQAARGLSFEIKGGEMEGSGVYFACNSTKKPIPFLIVKGICDWAVNKNGWSFVSSEKREQDKVKDCIQAFAAENAFQVVSYILSQISL